MGVNIEKQPFSVASIALTVPEAQVLDEVALRAAVTMATLNTAASGDVESPSKQKSGRKGKTGQRQPGEAQEGIPDSLLALAQPSSASQQAHVGMQEHDGELLGLLLEEREATERIFGPLGRTCRMRLAHWHTA